jgi:2,4-dienoyl-CoA reductase-like NADH-dependent reductase (Old Yellow Enzyme family)
MPDISSLFSPFVLGDLKLSNRIVMAPMTRARAAESIPGDDVAAYYRRRAAADVGLIITEGTTIDHPAASGSASIPAFHGDALNGWKHVLDEVHAVGGHIMPQLWHLGMARDASASPRPDCASVGPSGIADSGKPTSPPMTDETIQDVVDAFGRAAAAAQALGFDGVELHGAHGYLIDQFFWSGTNKRTDSWGGDFVQRTRFGAEVIRTVRQAVGARFPILLRWSQWKMNDYEASLVSSPLELEQFLAPLVSAGVTAFHCSTRRFWQPEFSDADPHLNLAGWTKKITGLPTISVGSVGLSREDSRTNRGDRIETNMNNLQTLAAMLERGDFDLIAIGRALLANPEWARLVRENRFDELVDYSGAALKQLL